MKKLALGLVIFISISFQINAQWYTITTPYNNNFNAVYFVDKNIGWICADSGLILHTTNRGIAWTKQISGTSKRLNDLKFISSQNGWVIGDSGVILHTDNGGLNWIVQPSGLGSRLWSISSIDSAYCKISGAGGMILHTTNGGINWLYQNIGFNDVNLTSIYFINRNKGWLGGFTYYPGVGTFAGIQTTENSGISWQTQYDGYGIINEISFLDENYGWVSGIGNFILKTVDAGNHWKICNLSQQGITFKHFLVKPNVGWVTSYLYGNNIHFTSDDGNSWTVQNQSESMYNDINFVEQKFGWAVGNNGLIVHTDNGGGVFPTTPLLIAPANNQQLVSDTINFVWSSATPQITGYHFYLSTDSLFSNLIDTLITDTTILLSNLEINTKYYWKVKAKNGIGSGDESETYYFKTTLTGIDGTQEVPLSFSLSQNYPNPFNPSTSIKYAISSRQFVTLKVYDVLGKEVATLVNEEKPAGMYNVEFNSVETLHATSLPSGVYFYQLKTGDFIETKKMILMK